MSALAESSPSGEGSINAISASSSTDELDDHAAFDDRNPELSRPTHDDSDDTSNPSSEGDQHDEPEIFSARESSDRSDDGFNVEDGHIEANLAESGSELSAEGSTGRYRDDDHDGIEAKTSDTSADGSSEPHEVFMEASSASPLQGRFNDLDTPVPKAASEGSEDTPTFAWGELNDPDVAVRRAAFVALADLPVKALTSRAVDVAVHLDDSDGEVRKAARHALCKLPADIARNAASNALWRSSGQNVNMQTATAAKFVDHGNPRRKEAALETPGEMLHVARSLVTQLRASSVAVRAKACKILGKLPPDIIAPHASALAERLQDSSSQVREAACETLEKLPASVLGSYAGVVAKQLKSPDSALRQAACRTLGKMPPDVLGGHVSQIAKQLEDSNALIRKLACETLGRLLPFDLATQVTRLAEQLKDPDASVRQVALETVCMIPAKIGYQAASDSFGKLPTAVLTEYAATLVVAIQDPNPRVRVKACTIIGVLPADILAKHSRAVAENLLGSFPSLRETKMLIKRKRQRQGLRELPAELLMSQAEKEREESRSSLRKIACEVLGRLPTNLLLSFADLVAEQLKDPSASTRSAVCDTLGQLPPKILAKYAPGIVEQLKDSNPPLRNAAYAACLKLPVDVLETHVSCVAKLHGPDAPQSYRQLLGPPNLHSPPSYFAWEEAGCVAQTRDSLQRT